VSFPSSDKSFLCGFFFSSPVGKIHLEFLFMHQRHMSENRRKREIFVHSRLFKTQRKGERRAKISPTNFNRLIITVIEQHNFEAKKKEKDLHSQSPYYSINAFSALFSL